MDAATNIIPISKRSTAALLQARLKDAEAQIDTGTANAADLVGMTIRAAVESGIHRTAIQRMLLRLHSAQGHGLKAQWDLQIYHQQCREQLSKLDLEVLGWGDTTGTPPMAQALFGAAEAGLEG